MEVVVPVHFESTTTTTTPPYLSAPSSPKPFFLYTTAPSSPAAAGQAITIDDDFSFEFTWQLQKSAPPEDLTSADELFEQGKIRPLNLHPFAAPINKERDMTPSSAFSPTISPSRSRKKSKSMSLLGSQKGDNFQTPTSSHKCGGEGSRNWRIMDFLLFRSASEGRATGDRNKDPLRKFTALPSSSSSPFLSQKPKKERGPDESMSSSFRSVGSNGSAGQERTRNSVSPHAMHYMENRSAAVEMRKKTALPYRQSFFSCLQFSPALHSLARSGFSEHFSNRGRP